MSHIVLDYDGLLKELVEVTKRPVSEAIHFLRGRQGQLEHLVAQCDDPTIPVNSKLGPEDKQRALRVLSEIRHRVSILMDQQAAAAGLQVSRPTMVADNGGPPEIPSAEVIYDPMRGLLGSGAFGKVYRGSCRGVAVAVKIAHQALSEEKRKQLREEATIMRKIYNPNVILFLGISTSGDKVMLITELLANDLDQWIYGDPEKGKASLASTMYDDPRRLNAIKLRIARDAALGMNWLHGICHIIHRDVKPGNILMDSMARCKICDFGLSELLVGAPKRDAGGKIKGTPYYCAPEILQQRPIDFPVDVYAYGLILYELFYEKPVFREFDELLPFVNAVVSGVRPQIPSYDRPRPAGRPGCVKPPARIEELIQWCWQGQPAERPTFSQILSFLDEIILATTASDPAANAFWKKLFNNPLRTEVNWSELVPLMVQQSGMSHSYFEPLRALLCATEDGHRTSDTVTLHRFNLVTMWFGPFFEENKASVILPEIAALMQQEWFHTDESKNEATTKLLNMRKYLDSTGNTDSPTFLVRLSFNTPDTAPYTLCVFGPSQHTTVNNYRIAHTGNPAKPFKAKIGDQSFEFVALREFISSQTKGPLLGEICVHNPPDVAY